MKILHVQETLSPMSGGPSTVLPQLARAQAAAGHDVVIATTNRGPSNEVYHEAGWDTLPSCSVPVFYAPVQFSTLRISRQLGRYLWSAIPDFDIVHVHGLYRFPTTTAAAISRRRKIPYVVRPHGALDPYLYARSTRGRLRLKRIYERLFDLPNLNAAGALHFTAEEERRRASFLELRSPSFVVPNGVEWGRFEVLPERGRLREAWGSGDAPVVLFLGRFHQKKGLDLLVPAFDLIRQSKPNARLVIAGPESDAYGHEVRRWVSERGLDAYVHFAGPLHGEDVVQAYVDSDVFVLPSYTENFGMTVVEAMSCALPVVISDQVNIHAEIANGSAGLVTRCEADEVCEALLTLLGDADLRAAMGAAGREMVKVLYSWPAIVDALTREYQGLIPRRD